MASSKKSNRPHRSKPYEAKIAERRIARNPAGTRGSGAQGVSPNSPSARPGQMAEQSDGVRSEAGRPATDETPRLLQDDAETQRDQRPQSDSAERPNVS